MEIYELRLEEQVNCLVAKNYYKTTALSFLFWLWSCHSLIWNLCITE